MPEVSNHGVNISYEVTGQGRPLVLLHGHYSDGSWWADTGYLDDLGRDHLLVNVDLRGHGHSDKPHEPSAYRGEALASDVLAVADAEGLDRFALWGLSYGGWIAWLTAYSAPQRVVAMIATGSWDPRPETHEEWVTWVEPEVETLRRGGMSDVIEPYEDERFRFPAAVKAVLLRADPQAMLASMSSELIGDGVPTLEGFPVPVLLIAGELEDEEGDVAKFAGMVPHGESLTLPGLGHAAACAASTLAIPTARVFLDRWLD
jgi:pimeloyl-ACP methyl ester carboxylesterase